MEKYDLKPVVDLMDESISKLNKLVTNKNEIKMEIVDFRTKTFGEIPTQDNPAYYADECILLCKAEEDQTGLYVVLKIDENHKDKDEVSQLGLFWNIEMALLFADNVPPNIKTKPVGCGKPIHKFLKHEFPLT